MAENSEDAASAAAAAPNRVVVSQTVSAMLDSATTSAAIASAAPRTPKGISRLDPGFIAAARIAETVSTILESATTAAVAATQEEHLTATVVAPERASASAAATTFVPPLSPPGLTVEHTSSSTELSGRHDHSDKEASETGELRRNDGAADRNQDSRGHLEPVIISDVARLVNDEATDKDENKGGVNESKADEKESQEARPEHKNTEESTKGKGVEEDEEHEEERLELPEENCEERVGRSSRAVDGNDKGTDRSQGPGNAVGAVAGSRGKVERRHGGGNADSKSEAVGEGPTTPNDRPAATTTTVPGVFPTHPAEEEGEIQQRWQWWDNENPWSRGPGSSTSTDQQSAGRRLSNATPPPPVYQATTPPPPYQEVVAGKRAPRYSMQQRTIEPQETANSNGRALHAVSAASNDASGSSDDDTSRGPPPSYRAAVVGGAASLSSPRDRDEEKQNSTGHLPPPSYGRFYDDFHSATFTSPLQGGTKSDGAKSDGGEWWAQDQDQDHQYGPVWSGEGHGRELESGRRRHHVSSGDTGGGRRNPDRPETNGDEREEERLGETSWRRRQHGEGRRRRTAAAGGSSRPKTTMALPREKSGNKDTTLR